MPKYWVLFGLLDATELASGNGSFAPFGFLKDAHNSMEADGKMCDPYGLDDCEDHGAFD